MKLKRGDPRHGSRNGYNNHKCRCKRCTAANAKTRKIYLDAHPEQRQKNNERMQRRYLLLKAAGKL